jgi:DNA-binding transcriptional MerR regulator
MAAKKDTLFERIEEIEIDEDLPVFTTGVVCRILDVPVWILKQLDREGIVSPDRKSQGEARLYSKNQLQKVYECWYLMKEKRVNVHGVKVILEIHHETVIKKKR